VIGNEVKKYSPNARKLVATAEKYVECLDVIETMQVTNER